MIPIDALTLGHLARELDVKLADGKINKIQQPGHFELLLHLWVGGEAGRQKLYINIEPQYAFAALLDDTRFLSFPETAPNFCMVLRKHLTGARIREIKTLPDERVLNFSLENYNELGQFVRLVLSIELMGKHSNIILYDEELEIIIACAHGVSEQMSRLREVSVGYPYIPPPRPAKPLFSRITRSAFLGIVQDTAAHSGMDSQALATAMVSHYAGVGTALLKDLFTAYPEPEAAYAALQDLYRGERLHPALKRDKSAFSLLPAHDGDPAWEDQPSINAMIRDCFLGQVRRDRLQKQRQQFLQIVKQQEKKLLDRLEELDKTDADAVARLKKAGDLLMLAASQQQAFTGSRMTLEDYDSGQPMEIELDPQQTLTENAQAYYRRYKKALTRQQFAEDAREKLNHALSFVETVRQAIALAAAPDDLEAVREDMIAQGWLKPESANRKNKGKEAASQPLSLTSSDGLTMYVGRNNLQNDLIIRKVGHPDDIWCHAHLIPGSHVLIKTRKQEAVPVRTLEEAGMLAAYYSQARESVNVPIVYTRLRYVRKIPESYPGHVNYTHEQSFNITPDPERINPLLLPGTPREPSADTP